MVLFNYATRELTAKIVYYGPGLCGKTTNLEYIHKSLPEKTRGKILSLATQTDRTLFFDFLPMDLGTVKGMKTRVQLYTVPGQVFYDATRKLVLKGADGVVFVVDSQKEMFESNPKSWENLKQNLSENNLDINTIPLVIQFNKRDLPNVLPVKELNRKINVVKAPYFEAIAITGVGVQETLKGIAKVVLQNLSRRYGQEDAEAQEAGTTRGTEQESIQMSAPAIPIPTDVTLDLSALEEIKDLPHAEELESGAEDSPITLEPVTESIEDSASLGELEDLPELHPEPEVPNPTELAAPGREEPPFGTVSISKASKKSTVTITGRLKAIESEMAAMQKLEESKSRSRSAPEVELVLTEVATASNASVAAAGSITKDVSIPVEVSVGKKGQEIKLHIFINLKIRLQPD